MNTVSDRIRAAALGPTPVWPSWPSNWFGGERVREVYLWAHDKGFWSLDQSNKYNDTRRMFLLFVAEALES